LSEQHQRALELLRLDKDQEANSETQNLAAEVDRYLGVSTRGHKDAIAFWVVSFILNLRDHTENFVRRTKMNFQHYSSLQWTYFQYKLPQFSVKGYFLPVKKQ